MEFGVDKKCPRWKNFKFQNLLSCLKKTVLKKVGFWRALKILEFGFCPFALEEWYIIYRKVFLKDKYGNLLNKKQSF